MRILPKLGLISCIAIGPLVSVSFAQNEYFVRDKYEAVTERVQPEYDPIPIRVGVFDVRSNAQLGITSNSNVFAAPNNEQSEIIARLGAEAFAKTTWANNEVYGEVGAFRSEYFDTNEESSTDARARLGGRLDVTKSFTVGASGYVEQRNEARRDFANAIGVDGPVNFTISGVQAEANFQTGRLLWGSSVSLDQVDFDDGRLNVADLVTGSTEFDQDFRDNTRTTGRSRVTYAVTPDFAVFGQASAYTIEYDQTQIVNVPNPTAPPATIPVQRSRDSDGYTAAVGANFELSSLLRGDVAVGYFSEDKSDPTLLDFDGLSLDGQVIWFPSRLTNVTFDARRQPIDLGLIESPTAVQSSYGVRVDHEFRRNIIGSIVARFVQEDYDDISRTDEAFDIGVLGAYKLNRKVRVEGFVRQIGRDVTGVAVAAGLSHDINLIGVGIRVSP